MALILKKYEFNKDETVGPVLAIEGSSGGLFGRLLTALGIDNQSTLAITRREVTFRFANLAGISYTVCPLDSLTCSLSGISKPILMLYFGILATLGGLGTLITGSPGGLTSLIILVLGIGALYTFITAKTLVITFSTGDMGDVRGLAFESATIGGKTVDLPLILTTITEVNRLIVDAEERKRG